MAKHVLKSSASFFLQNELQLLLSTKTAVATYEMQNMHLLKPVFVACGVHFCLQKVAVADLFWGDAISSSV